MEALLFRLIQEKYISGFYFSRRFSGDYSQSSLTFSHGKFGLNTGWEAVSAVDLYQNWEQAGRINPWGTWCSGFYKLHFSFREFEVHMLPSFRVIYLSWIEDSFTVGIDGLLVFGRDLSPRLHLAGFATPPTLSLQLLPETRLLLDGFSGNENFEAGVLLLYRVSKKFNPGAVLSYIAAQSPTLKISSFAKFKQNLVMLDLFVSPVSVWLENRFEAVVYSIKDFSFILTSSMEFHPLGTGFKVGLIMLQER